MTFAYCEDSKTLSKQFQTVKAFADSQDIWRLSRQLHTVRTVANFKTGINCNFHLKPDRVGTHTRIMRMPRREGSLLMLPGSLKMIDCRRHTRLSWPWPDFFHRIGPLGWFDLVVAMSVPDSVCLSPSHAIFLRPWTDACVPRPWTVACVRGPCVKP